MGAGLILRREDAHAYQQRRLIKERMESYVVLFSLACVMQEQSQCYT
jgi:hypothetical protein